MENNRRVYLSVGEVNEYIRMMLAADPMLCDIYVKGEISNFNNHYKSGHYYFSLKDGESIIGAVMFQSYARSLSFLPENGMKVIAHGGVSAYVRDGRYQLYVRELVPEGVGAAAVAFEQLKRKLGAEGLFDASHKKPLPRFPKTVGIITSETGAAVHDIVGIISRRYPCVGMFLYPSLVQGAKAPESLCRGIDFFTRTHPVDVIIIGRGGGSAEDLSAFNDEKLARKIAASEIPVISAVGHESDFTICDFVADLRAPTPSAAAELAVPDKAELLPALDSLVLRLDNILDGRIRHEKQYLAMLGCSRTLSDPYYFVSTGRERLDIASERLDRATDTKLAAASSQLTAMAAKLGAFDPLSAAFRDYSIVFSDKGRIINGIRGLKPGDAVKIKFADGQADAKITAVNPDDKI